MKKMENIVDNKEYYVWYDTFLEETFVIEKNVYDLKKLFEQLKKEKITVYDITAENKKEALKVFEEKYSNASLVCKNQNKIMH